MIRLAKPYIPAEALRRVTAVLESGILIQSREVASFEESLAAYLGVEETVAVSSGTAALHLALLALGIGPGDEVIVPAFTYPASANVVEIVGAKTVLVDIKLEDCCMDMSRVEAAITPRTRAIMVVHEFGQSADMKALIELANRRSIPIIEDAACALGTEFHGAKVGTFGIIGCFSLHPRKAITTGEGGVVIARDKELVTKMRALRNHGIAPGQPTMDFIYAGLNYRMTEFQAALGAVQLAEMSKILAERAKIAAAYDKALAGFPLLSLPPRIEGRTQVYQTYHVILDERVPRDEVIKLMRDAGVETNLGAQALHRLTYYREKYRFAETQYPVALRAYRSGLALPIGTHLTVEEAQQVARTLHDVLAQY